MSEMNYEEAMAFLEETKKYGSQLGLNSIRSLMEQLGNIQEQVPVVHIGGTNGKGSIGAMLSSILTEAGYKVGRFNTPDVFSYEEEFLMNGNPISKKRLAKLFTKVSEACNVLVQKGLPHPTRFEVETGAAFLWFYEEKCDIALVEVGMGGATDATNLITRPLVSVLTSVRMDHMKFLGNSLAEIASVKAGIIKPGCPLVSMKQEPEVMEVLKSRLEELEKNPKNRANRSSRQIRFLVADPSVAEDVICTPEETSFCVGGDVRISLGLRGFYQVENAVCVLYVLHILREIYEGITREAIVEGFKKVSWPGRFEQVESDPRVILDGAHNEDAVRKLRQSLDLVFPGKRIIFLMGVLADKEYDKMISMMFQERDRVYTVTPPNPRALFAEDLAKKLQKQNIDAVPCQNVSDAIKYAKTEAGPEDVIVAFGSLYYLGEVRKALIDRNPDSNPRG